MPALTIGLATYNDYHGVYFTLQSLHLHHDLTDTELLVVDNYGCDSTRRFVESTQARYVRFTDATGTAPTKHRVFQEARGDAVLCTDSHVLFGLDAIARLKDYYRAHPACTDLLQGPLVTENQDAVRTHLDPVWNQGQWGVVKTDPRGLDPDGEPFEIPAQIMAVFSCRRDAWPGVNPCFRGYGGEDGYISEKVRQRGDRTLCLPFFRWVHRFHRPTDMPYQRLAEEYLRNTIIGFTELGLDLAPMLTHFALRRGADWVRAIVEQTLRDDLGTSLALDLSGP